MEWDYLGYQSPEVQPDGTVVTIAGDANAARKEDLRVGHPDQRGACPHPGRGPEVLGVAHDLSRRPRGFGGPVDRAGTRRCGQPDQHGQPTPTGGSAAAASPPPALADLSAAGAVRHRQQHLEGPASPLLVVRVGSGVFQPNGSLRRSSGFQGRGSGRRDTRSPRCRARWSSRGRPVLRSDHDELVDLRRRHRGP